MASRKNILGTFAAAGLALAGVGLTTAPADAAPIRIHLTGSSLGGWGVWVVFDVSVFSTPGADANTGSIDYFAPGTGNPMDLLMPLPDGTVADGTQLDDYMGTVEVLGGLGTDEVVIGLPDLWAHIGPLSLHLIFNSASHTLRLESVDPDGTHNYAMDVQEPFVWGLQSMGTVQPFEVVADRIEFSAPGFIGAPCRADFDGNTTVNVFDILAFLQAWNNGGPGADFDGNMTVNVFDILAFLAEWNAGCP